MMYMVIHVKVHAQLECLSNSSEPTENGSQRRQTLENQRAVSLGHATVMRSFLGQDRKTKYNPEKFCLPPYVCHDKHCPGQTPHPHPTTYTGTTIIMKVHMIGH